MAIAVAAASFRARLDARCRHVGNYLCVGLDPDPSRLPVGFARSPDGVMAFNRLVLAATVDTAACYKPNLAFYEALGPDGWRVLAETLANIPPEIPVIADAKRGDVGNTAAAYARALCEVYGFSCSTVNPYMGHDAVAPFLAYPHASVLLLVRTSNPGAADFQDLRVDGEPLYAHVVRSTRLWPDADRIGYVVGATAPAELAMVRDLAPDATLLVPGVGAQGGDAQEAVRRGAAARGGGLTVNVSRGILYPEAPGPVEAAMRDAARRFADMLAVRS